MHNTAALPARCELQHRLFKTMGEVRFRRSPTDGVTMLAVRLGEREAHMPLESVRREFAIGRDSADGRMLDLIGSALDFVATVQPGDRLPAEVCTGEASWRPSAYHLRLAATRLRLDLVAWVMPGSRWAEAGRDPASLVRAADDPALQADVGLVSAAVAGRLGLANGDDVTRLMDKLAQELAYIEALRERLQMRVAGLCRRLGRMLHDRKRPAVLSETLSQVHRLATTAARQIVGRFEEVDAQTGEIGSLLRNVANQRAFIRSNLDGLYRTLRAWEPVLERWGRAGNLPPEDMGALLNSTYRFLAQRSLPATTWQLPNRPRKAKRSAAGMTW